MKKLLLLIIPIILMGVWLYRVDASDSGALSPGTVITTDAPGNYGTVDWVNPGNATSSDNNYATITLNNEKARVLYATNFGFTIPTGATINGIKVDVEGMVVSYPGTVYCWVTKTSPIYGGNGMTWSETETYRTYGNNTYLWADSWTSSEINNSNFGVNIQTSFSTLYTNTISVDHIKITVYYTEAMGTPQRVQIRGGTIQIRGGRLGI